MLSFMGLLFPSAFTSASANNVDLTSNHAKANAVEPLIVGSEKTVGLGSLAVLLFRGGFSNASC